MPHRGNLNRPKLFPTFNTSVTQCLCYFLALLVAVLLIVNGSHAKEKKPELESWQLKGIVAALDDTDPLVWAEALNKLSRYELEQLKPPFEIPKDRIDQIADLLAYKHESDETENERKSVQSKVHASAAEALGEIGPAAYKYTRQIAELLTDEDSDVHDSAAYALGQMGADASEYIPEIAKLLIDSDGNVSRSAAKALGQMGVAKDYAPQIAKRLTHSDLDVRYSAAYALGQMGAAASKYAPQIISLLTDSDNYYPNRAASALGEMGAAASEYVPQIISLLTDSDSDVRYSAASALGEMGAAASEYVPQIISLLTDSDSDVRYSAVRALGEMGAAASKYAPQIVERLTDSNIRLRASAARALGQMGAAAYKYAPQIAKLLTDEDSNVRSRAARALGQMGAAAYKYAPQITKLLSHSNIRLRANAALALAEMGAAPSEIAPQILELLTDSDWNVRYNAAKALGEMGAAPSQYTPQIAKLLTYSDWNVRYSAAAALEKMAPLQVKHILSVLNQVYWYQREAPSLRFLAYFLSGGDKNSLLLIHWLGSPEQYPHEIRVINHQEGLDVLKLFAQIWEDTQSLSKLRKDLERQIAIVVDKVKWEQTDMKLLKQHYKNLKSIDSQLAAAVNAQIIALEGKHWFLIAFKIWLIHVSCWCFLIIIYPRSAQVQGLIWDWKFRTIVGLGYISIALTWIPWLRYRLLAPFREVLVADASLDSFDPQAYFPNSYVKIRRATHTQPIQTAIAQLQSPIVLEGESGLGKSMFLRNLVKTSGRLSVYLPASQCAGGVVEGIQAKLPIAAHDPLFLQSLINYNTLDICIDGLNEVSPDTRATINTFVDHHVQGHIILTTQPLEWTPPATAKTYVLQPLKRQQIAEFLTSRQGILPEDVPVSGVEYEQACDDYLASQLHQNQSKQELTAVRRFLSNPMDLTLVAQLLAQGKDPDLLNLQQQQYEIMAEDYQQIHLYPFPLAEFAETVYQMRLHDQITIPENDCLDELQCMERYKMVLTRQQKDGFGRTYREWYFRHDKIQEYFIVQTFLKTENRERQHEHLSDPRFRGVYLLLATLLEVNQALVLREVLIQSAAETKDHAVSDQFIQRFNSRQELTQTTNNHGELALSQKHNQNLIEIIKLVASRPITVENKAMSESTSDYHHSNYHSKYDQRQSQHRFNNFVDATQSEFNQEIDSQTQNNYAPEKNQTLSEAAAEIQQLLKQLEQSNPNATDLEKTAFVNIAIPASTKQRLLSALESGGKEALRELLDNPYVNVGMAIVEGWQNPS
ncbi:HEAT repeat domain-containing protein [Moorena producens JHB]|uniref:HEAT repeat domain-containing protein n=1 Tax=Moorena producens (strain JHB) TaxID=1454205 RepID=A0A1D9G1U7_MOOP1|nr:HEAT repeat domain-containing protein [Moorena producens]AOY81599.2 HEAT repeat domain-containing protein [Moorena producens JHB]